MKRAKQLDTIVFSYNTLHIVEEAEGAEVIAESKMSAGGSHIVFEALVVTPYITLTSGEHSWVTEDDITALKALWVQIGATFTLTYDDDSTETVRMAKEKKMEFTPIFEGSNLYIATIPLAKFIT